VICPQCGQPCLVTVHHTHVIQYRSGPKRIEWDECFTCNAREDARAAQLKAEAEQDRAVKLPPSAPSKRQRRDSGPFALQLEEQD
jgi:hypothetical protein